MFAPRVLEVPSGGVIDRRAMKTASRFVRALQQVSLRLAGVGVLGGLLPRRRPTRGSPGWEDGGLPHGWCPGPPWSSASDREACEPATSIGRDVSRRLFGTLSLALAVAGTHGCGFYGPEAVKSAAAKHYHCPEADTQVRQVRRDPPSYVFDACGWRGECTPYVSGSARVADCSAEDLGERLAAILQVGVANLSCMVDDLIVKPGPRRDEYLVTGCGHTLAVSCTAATTRNPFGMVVPASHCVSSAAPPPGELEAL